MSQTKKETFEFQSEVKQLLDILVYSLYKNKEVFIRELVSNAVDALNKAQFEILTQKDVKDKDTELRIDISVVKSQKKLIIEDSGVGMTRKELIENIGTIAHSGTMDFLKKLAESQGKEQIDLIGKFGVGFYSSFMAAQEIHLYTRSFRKSSRAFLWKSKGAADFTIEETVKKQRGTRIELLLKKDAEEFLNPETIRGVLAKYSKFVPFPIYIENSKIEAMEAIWTQPKTGLKEKDYFEFFRFFDNTQEDPETYIHLSSDAPVQFHALLYIPKTSLERLMPLKMDPGVDLYTKKVLIQKASRDVLPDYLRFIKGVIDSEDIPLNISRETIQSHVKIEKIRRHILKKLLAHLKKIKDKDRDQYLRIWDNFHRQLKEGVVTDHDHRDRLAPLLLFHSSKMPKEEFSDLDGYVERMGEKQEGIYYITGLDLDTLDKNPALEAFRKKDLEVLYLDDPLDEFVVEHLREFSSKPFKMVESADIKLDKKATDDSAYLQNLDKLIVYLKELYGDKVADVRLSQRLIESPCLLVHAADGPSIHVEKILKMANREYQFARKIFEINPDNALIKELARLHTANPQSRTLKSLSLQLLDNMLLREGIIDDIDTIIPRIQEIMLQAARARKPRARKKPG